VAASIDTALSVDLRPERPELLPWTDEESFRTARRKWERFVRLDTGLLETHRLVLWHVASFAGWEEAHMFPFVSAETVAEDLGISLSTAKRAFIAARQRGWLIRMRRRGFGGAVEHGLSYLPSLADTLEDRQIWLKAAREGRRLQKAHPRPVIGVTHDTYEVPPMTPHKDHR
jgi:hypothetical protein